MSIASPQKLPEKKPSKPGKWYGIIALLCGLEPFLFVFYSVLLELFGVHFGQSPWHEISWVLGTLGIPCAVAALIFGIMGRRTQGKLYAYIGIALSLSFGALMLFTIGFAFYWFVILGHPM